MKINKNGKNYFYWYPNYNGYDYNYLVDKLSDLDIETARIGYKYCRIKSNKRILTKLKKFFGNDKVVLNNFDLKYSYTIFLLEENEILKIFEQLKNK